MAKSTIDLLQKPSKISLAGQITGQIKKLIFENKFEVGDKLPPERELAESLNVSRVVVREALKSLEQAGFIDRSLGPAGGSVVSDKVYKPFFDSVHDLLLDGQLTIENFYEARAAIEAFSARQAAAKATVADIKQLEEINERMREKISDAQAFAAIHAHFHIKIAEMSGNPLIKLMIAALMNVLRLVMPIPSMSEEFIENTYGRHSRIIEAIRNNEVDLSEELMIDDASFLMKIT